MNYALVTIDTEAWHGDDPVSRFIWGETRDGRHGIEELVDLMSQHNISGIFFLDFAECWDYGEERISEVAHFLKSKGQTVGVHVHPDHMADKSREFLWEYDAIEQREILEKVTIKYEEIMGIRPRYFRAGKYSANNETLQIIEGLGYSFDFSEFYGRNWCQIDPPVTADRLCMVGNLLEVPVTSFVAFRAMGFERVDKIDMEMSPSIFRYITKKFAKNNNGQVISLFGHSFSFVGNRYSEDMSELFYDYKNKEKFESALRMVERSRNISLISPNDFERLYDAGELSIELRNTTPSVVIKNPVMSVVYFYATAWRIRGFNRKAKLLIESSGVLFALLCASIVALFSLL